MIFRSKYLEKICRSWSKRQAGTLRCLGLRTNVSTLYQIPCEPLASGRPAKWYQARTLRWAVRQDNQPLISFGSSWNWGRTSVAKIFAKAMNCLTKSMGPCNWHPLYLSRSITNGSLEDVIEIDAAHPTIELDEIPGYTHWEYHTYAPSLAKHKVYYQWGSYAQQELMPCWRRWKSQRPCNNGLLKFSHHSVSRVQRFDSNQNETARIIDFIIGKLSALQKALPMKQMLSDHCSGALKVGCGMPCHFGSALSSDCGVSWLTAIAEERLRAQSA